jgi:hypothetical protein
MDFYQNGWDPAFLTTAINSCMEGAFTPSCTIKKVFSQTCDWKYQNDAQFNIEQVTGTLNSIPGMKTTTGGGGSGLSSNMTCMCPCSCSGR